MRIRILTSLGGFPCGAEVDVEESIAADWIGTGDAEAVAVSRQSIETAVAVPPETAMRQSAKRGRA